mgnify:CR=1 FL=1
MQARDRTAVQTVAIVMDQPETLRCATLPLTPAGDEDVVVDIELSGISTGTERLLYSGRMPQFPGMGYPLVPGYESVGRIAEGGTRSGHRVGQRVFVPGARCYGEVRGLFGGSASRVVTPGTRVISVPESLGDDAVLLALAATAQHAIAPGVAGPVLVVGHGVLGRLLARLLCASGLETTVWECNPMRCDGAEGYQVIDPGDDTAGGYATVVDASGDPGLIDTLIARLKPGGELVLAGFYSEPVQFAFPPAFMKEPRLRIAAEWRREDLDTVLAQVDSGAVSLSGLITHRADPADPAPAYRTAFEDPACLKMVLDWRTMQ